ncbi:MAG: pyrB [Bacillales bacterium]|jgi:aspartate carbamoyltransferase catalytic subunit|nr:pyrB [Bacillales bacterium]
MNVKKKAIKNGGKSMLMTNRDLINTLDFSIEEQESILSIAQKIILRPVDFANSLNGKIMGSLFFEPSTRTRLSFEAAMHRLGGAVIGFSEQNASSVSKGESLRDTIQTVAQYSDVIVMRHPKEGAPVFASKYSEVPIINAGDGGREHPTQTLTDILTIRSKMGKLNNLTIGLCGDLKFGRTVHSLVKNISRYPNINFIFVSPKELEIPDYIKNYLNENQIEYKEMENLEEAIQHMDVLYMTRVQKERFFNEEDYIRLKDSYILDTLKMKLAKKNMIILHPLPRVNEISYDVDSDPRAMYFKQTKYGMVVRMALLYKILHQESFKQL